LDIALIIGIPVVIILAAVTVLASARRRSSDAQGRATGRLGAETKASDSSALAVTDDTSEDARARAEETKVAAGGVPAKRGKTSLAEMAPADYEEIQVSRRQFFNRSIITTMAISIGAFGAAAISFLYAKSAGGFGGKVDSGISLTGAQAYWDANKAPFYVPDARTYLQPYPVADVPKAKKIPNYIPVIPGMEQGIVALYQKCVHLGCRVPWCQTSQWFECPCHGSKYSRVGEKKGGPAPRGLDHFVVTIAGSKMTIDTTLVVTGPPIGTDTTNQGAEGPPCV
jgi:cytochrome b6-f complex iron-sulfur subunit